MTATPVNIYYFQNVSGRKSQWGTFKNGCQGNNSLQISFTPERKVHGLAWKRCPIVALKLTPKPDLLTAVYYGCSNSYIRLPYLAGTRTSVNWWKHPMSLAFGEYLVWLLVHVPCKSYTKLPCPWPWSSQSSPTFPCVRTWPKRSFFRRCHCRPNGDSLAAMLMRWILAKHNRAFHVHFFMWHRAEPSNLRSHSSCFAQKHTHTQMHALSAFMDGLEHRKSYRHRAACWEFGFRQVMNQLGFYPVAWLTTSLWIGRLWSWWYWYDVLAVLCLFRSHCFPSRSAALAHVPRYEPIDITSQQTDPAPSSWSYLSKCFK